MVGATDVHQLCIDIVKHEKLLCRYEPAGGDE